MNSVNIRMHGTTIKIICDLFDFAARISDYVASNGRLVSEWCVRNYVERSGLKHSFSKYPALDWSDWEKPRKLSVRTV